MVQELKALGNFTSFCIRVRVLIVLNIARNKLLLNTKKREARLFFPLGVRKLCLHNQNYFPHLILEL